MSPTQATDEPTRKERREQARAQRKALEEQARARAARRRLLARAGGALGVIVVIAVTVILAIGSGGGKSASSPTVSGGSGASAGLQTTPGPWPPEYNNLATRLQALNLPGQSDTIYHVHAALRVYVSGKPIQVPANVGIDPQGQFLAPLHTHDTSGIMHLEASQQYPFTLSQFFTVWGVKFTNNQLGGNVAGNGNVLAVYVNGKPVANPVAYVMKPHDDVVVGYGKPGSFPTSFQYPWATSNL